MWISWVVLKKSEPCIILKILLEEIVDQMRPGLDTELRGIKPLGKTHPGIYLKQGRLHEFFL